MNHTQNSISNGCVRRQTSINFAQAILSASVLIVVLSFTGHAIASVDGIPSTASQTIVVDVATEETPKVSAQAVTNADPSPPVTEAKLPMTPLQLFGPGAAVLRMSQKPVESIRSAANSVASGVSNVANATAGGVSNAANATVQNVSNVATATVNGVLQAAGFLQRGIASWYGEAFHNRKTANGERFDMNAMTAAHRTLPFGTMLCAHAPSTGRTIAVRINDRGPFIAGRIIDLSKAAAKALGISNKPDTVTLSAYSESNCSQ